MFRHKEHRLRSNRDFQMVYQKGRFFASHLLVLYTLPQAKTTTSRLGYSIARKTGKAILRNRVRRRLREIVHLGGSTLPLEGFDFILLARQGAATATYRELTTDFDRVLLRFGRWHREEKKTGG